MTLLNALLFGGLIATIGMLIELVRKVDKLQAQVEHLHNVMLGELQKGRPQVRYDPEGEWPP